MKQVICAILAFLAVTAAWGQTVVRTPDLSVCTKVAPMYFGPTAFPVPDIADDVLASGLEVELSGEAFVGNLCKGEKDFSADPFLKVRIPLFSDRVNLSLWMPVIEFWSFSEEVRRARRVSEDVPLEGHDSGDAYVSLDIKLLEESGWKPDIILRSVLKSASGNSFGPARHYDAPGYFFDISAAKSVFFGETSFVRELRGGLSTGFLCWQTDNGRQNDAVMYGALVSADTKVLRLRADFGGYSGWEHDGDRPMSMKLRADIHTGGCVDPFFYWQKGFRDWPFSQYRLGLRILL